MHKLPRWVLLAALSAAPGAAQPQGDIAVAKWREDLAVLREQMPKSHGNLFHTMTRRQFDGALDELEQTLPGLSPGQVKVGIMRLVAMVNDGHTRVRQETLGNHLLPLKLHFFADGLYVVSAEKSDASIVGGKVTKIGRMSAEEAYAAVRPLLSVDADNEGRRRLLAVNFLVMPEVLHALGATNDANLVGLSVEKEGREITTALPGESIASWNDGSWVSEPVNWVSARANTGNLPPLWLRHPDRHYWHAFLDDGKTLYVQYTQSKAGQ